MTNNYLVATKHQWNLDEYNHYSKTLPGNWYLITDKDSLTLNYLKTINPRYIFFPHWSWLVPQEVISQYECVCFHMTDVPYGRGGSPLQNLILRGHKNTKVSALKMIEELDAGPVYLKTMLDLSGNAESIFSRLSPIIAKMIKEIVYSEPSPEDQVGQIEMFERRKPEQSEIPQDLSNIELYDFIRMLDAPGYPKAYSFMGDKKLEFSNAQLINGELTANIKIGR